VSDDRSALIALQDWCLAQSVHIGQEMQRQVAGACDPQRAVELVRWSGERTTFRKVADKIDELLREQDGEPT
jgi:hypothetical protein